MIGLEILSAEAVAYTIAYAEPARALPWRRRWLFLTSIALGWRAEATPEMADVLTGAVLAHLTSADDVPDRWKSACVAKFSLDAAARRRVNFQDLIAIRPECSFSKEDAAEVDFAVAHAAALGRQALANWPRADGAAGA